MPGQSPMESKTFKGKIVFFTTLRCSIATIVQIMPCDVAPSQRRLDNSKGEKR
jgi:hypothetical protein